jgi:hypothetical protein
MFSFRQISCGFMVIVTGLCLIVWLWNLLSIATGPTVPDFATGHLLSYNNHGTIHYMTTFQCRLLNGSWLLGFFAAMVGITIKNPNWWRTMLKHRGQK